MQKIINEFFKPCCNFLLSRGDLDRDTAIFLNQLVDLNITNTISKCPSEQMKDTLITLYELLIHIQSNLKLPFRIKELIRKAAKSITKLHRANGDPTKESIALYNVACNMLKFDLLLYS